MVWIRLDDSFVEDPRIETAGPLALALHVAALSYCNRNLTDGAITKARAARLLALDEPAEVIRALIDAGLWLDAGESVTIADFHDWQPSREDVEKRRADTAARTQRWRDRQRDAVTGRVRDASSTHAPSRPGPKGKGTGTGVRSSADAPDLPPSEERPTITKRADGVTVVRLPQPAWSPS
jgi:hypothetical protein